MEGIHWGLLIGFGVSLILLFATKWWEPFADNIGYPFSVPRRVKDFLNAVEGLCQTKRDLLRLDPHPYSERCMGWLKKVEDLCIEAEEIKKGESEIGWSYFRRCQIGVQADRGLKKSSDLVSDGKSLLQSAWERPHLVRNVLPQYPQCALFGMDSYKDKILQFLKHKKNGHLGVWGMAGVGKTALMQLARDSGALMQLARDSGGQFANFDHVLYIKAGKGYTVEKMRTSLVVAMGLTSVSERKEVLICNHLYNKNFLLLVDDVWEHLDLNAVGIPLPDGPVSVPSEKNGAVCVYQRKIVIASRSWLVCSRMKCYDIIRVDCLSERNAWNLFAHNVGDEIAEDSTIHRHAKKIVDACGGLPMALCIIGGSLSTKRSTKEWKCAIDLLEESKLIYLTGMDESLFESLKQSFDDLAELYKVCFLLCSLWPENENIPREKLIEWWIGLGLLDVNNPVERGHSIITSLVEASLLQMGDAGLSSSHVKMHIMMRSMALWFVNDRGENRKWLPHSICRSRIPAEKWHMVEKAWVSLADSQRWLYSSCCPRLTMLVTRESFSLRAVRCFNEVTFLDLEGTKQDKFPMEICQLRKLQYLNLSATTIDALPLELSWVSNLKYLHVRNTGSLEIIPKGLISQLKRLQVLDLFCSGCNFHKSQYFASLMEELAGKTMDVMTLGITLRNRSDVTKLEQLINVNPRAVCLNNFQDESHPEKVDLRLLSKLENLQELAVVKSSQCKELVAEGNPIHESYGLLPDMDFLELNYLPNLEKVTWNNAGKEIQVLRIYNCSKLKHVSWVTHLPDLEELTISYCPELEQVVNEQAVATQIPKRFAKLKRLYLEELPALSSISEQSFSFEELSYVLVSNCEKLKAIRVEKRISQVKIMVDCSDSCWTALGQNQRMRECHFVRGPYQAA